MHFAFMPYGKRSEVELMLRDMEAAKHLLVMKKGSEERGIYIQGQVRLLPLGIVEYVCPKEDMDAVLHTLINNKNKYGLPRLIFTFARKMLKMEPIPEYKKDKQYLWIRENVNIIPIGIRKDDDLTEETGQYAGWTHEAI